MNRKMIEQVAETIHLELQELPALTNVSAMIDGNGVEKQLLSGMARIVIKNIEEFKINAYTDFIFEIASDQAGVFVPGNATATKSNAFDFWVKEALSELRSVSIAGRTLNLTGDRAVA